MEARRKNFKKSEQRRRTHMLHQKFGRKKSKNPLKHLTYQSFKLRFERDKKKALEYYGSGYNPLVYIDKKFTDLEGSVKELKIHFLREAIADPLHLAAETYRAAKGVVDSGVYVASSIVDDTETLAKALGFDTGQADIDGYAENLVHKYGYSEEEARELAIKEALEGTLPKHSRWVSDKDHKSQHMALALTNKRRRDPFDLGYRHEVPTHGNTLVHGQRNAMDSSYGSPHVFDQTFDMNPRDKSEGAVHNVRGDHPRHKEHVQSKLNTRQ